MQYEIVFKSDRLFMLYCLPQTVPAAQTAQKMTPGTGTEAHPKDHRLLTNTRPKAKHTISIQANTNKS